MVIYLKLLGAALLWGGTFSAGRVLAGQMGPYTAAFLRFAIASVLLVWLTLRIEGRLPRLTPKLTLAVLLLGLTGVFGYNLCFFTGLATVHAGRAAVIVASNPIFIALGAALFFGEPLTRNKLLGIVLSVTGAAWVISRGDPLTLLAGHLSTGDLWIMGCVASWVSYSLIGKVVMGQLSPLASVAMSCAAGTILLLPPALNEGLAATLPGFSLTAWGCLAYLGVLGTVVGFTWFYEGVLAIGPSKAGVFINFVPVSAVTIGFFALGEPVDASLALGGLLVITGTWCANRPARIKTTSP
ncbi:DMT family transporter [Desulfovibrio ferrophilus]|nr:DMT family transporter [Desulfovibrio ferrophilus]